LTHPDAKTFPVPSTQLELSWQQSDTVMRTPVHTPDPSQTFSDATREALPPTVPSVLLRAAHWVAAVWDGTSAQTVTMADGTVPSQHWVEGGKQPHGPRR
jgi:hypothetical protein